MSKRRALAGGAWSAIEIGSRQAVQFLVAVVLARLLTPAEFGIFGVAAFFSGFASGVLQTVLIHALIQKKDVSAQDEHSVFWFSLAISVAFSVLLVAASGWLARFYAAPILRPLAVAIGFVIVLNALAIVPSALLIRRLEFRRMAVLGVAASLVSALVGIAAGLAGAGVWALYLQLVVAALLLAAGTAAAARWLPRWRFRWQSVRSIAGFAGWLGVSAFLDTLFSQGVGPLVGKMFGVAPMGLFLRAQTTQALPNNVTGVLFSRIMLPLLAERQDDPESLRRYLLQSNQFLMAINVPLMLGLAVTADLSMTVLYGSQWTPAGPILAWLALGGILYPLHVSNLQLLMAIGQSRAVFRIELAKKMIAIVLLVAGGAIWGLPGLAAGLAATSLVALLVNMGPVRRAVGAGFAEQMGDLVPVYAAGALMALAVLVTRAVMPFDAAVLRLAVCVGVGVATYGASAVVFGVRALRWREWRPVPGLVGPA